MSSITFPSRSAGRGRWVDAWFRSDLVGIPVTLAVSGVIATSVGLYLVVGDWAGLFIGKLFFPLALLGLLGLLLRWGHLGETTEGVRAATASAHRRVLVLANDGLEHSAVRADVCRLAGRATEAMIVAPVAAASWLHALADDVDAELQTAQERVDAVVTTLRRAGVNAEGRAHLASPATALIDGLREFAATEILVLPSGDKRWTNANTLAQQIRTQLGLSVNQLDPSQISRAAAA
jgi:hypothetical protein